MTDQNAQTPPHLPWTSADYPFAAGSGADKLVSSGVAPLVALARGMRSLTKADVKDECKRNGWAMNSAPAKQLTRAVGETDALFMPWFTPEQVKLMDETHRTVLPGSVQLRPDPVNVQIDANSNKARKYENVQGMPLVIGPHPATPGRWLDGRAPLFFTEGMMKADSVLSAQLLARGISEDDLRVKPDETFADGRDRLSELMDEIDHPVLVIGFVSVTTFNNKPEWNSIRTTPDTQCYAAFDGDVATNPMVHNAATGLQAMIENKKGRASFIDLSSAVEQTGDAHLGVDDYLAAFGDFDSLLSLAKDQLPPKPFEERKATPGEWRMDNENCTTKAFAPASDEFSQSGYVAKHEFVARVKAIEVKRALTDEEFSHCYIDPSTLSAGQGSRAEVEVSYIDPSSHDIVHSIVSGPDDILTCPPSEWRRVSGVDVPSNVKALVTYPPRDPEFLRAMKENRRDETVSRPLWDHMGWVPSYDSTGPVFMIGSQVVGSDGVIESDNPPALCGVDNKEVAKASSYGLQMPDSDEEARQYIRETLRLYLPENPEDRPWRDRLNATIMVAAGLRSVMPFPARCPIALTGSSGAGKALPMDSLLPVPASSKFPTGWARNDELSVGDQLYAPDGSVTRVRDFSRVWTDEDCYVLHFDDGRSFTASGSHVMVASTSASRAAHVGAGRRPASTHAENLRALAGRAPGGTGSTVAALAQAVGRDQPWVSRVIADKRLPHDDRAVAGDLARFYPTGEFLLAAADRVDDEQDGLGFLTKNVTVADMAASHGAGWAVRVTSPVDGLSCGLDVAGVVAQLVAGAPVSVPVLRASAAERQAVLSGWTQAADSSTADSAWMVPCLPEQRDGLVELVQSLGGKARIGNGCMVVTMGGEWLHMTRVEKVETVATRCIQVEHPSCQFLAQGFVASHNTYSMATVMAFVSAGNGGGFTEKSLPGSANDTAAAAEVSMSKTLLWPVDDLAPDPSDPLGRKANGVWELVRASSNGAGRARRTSDMRAQVVNTPRALLMISAEASPDNKQSIMNRYIGVEVVKDQFLSASDKPTDLLRNSYTEGETPQSYVTGYIVRMLARRMRTEGWSTVRSQIDSEVETFVVEGKERAAKENAAPGFERQIRTAADLYRGVIGLEWACRELGMTEELTGVIRRMHNDMLNVSIRSLRRATTVDLGTQVVESVRSLLSSRRAHIGLPGSPNMPVEAGDKDLHRFAAQLNEQLGWELPSDDKSAPKPCGPRIGTLVKGRDGHLSVLLDPKACTAALSTFRGQSEKALFLAVRASRLHDDEWKPRASGGGAGWMQRVRGGEGVAVRLCTLAGYPRDEAFEAALDGRDDEN